MHHPPRVLQAPSVGRLLLLPRRLNKGPTALRPQNAFQGLTRAKRRGKLPSRQTPLLEGPPCALVGRSTPLGGRRFSVALPEAESGGPVRRAGPRMREPGKGWGLRKPACVAFSCRPPGFVSFSANFAGRLYSQYTSNGRDSPGLGEALLLALPSRLCGVVVRPCGCISG